MNNCGRKLGKGKGFEIVGKQGRWKGVRLNFCHEQCMMEWDCSGPDPAFKGNQGFNLAEDLDKLKPRE